MIALGIVGSILTISMMTGNTTIHSSFLEAVLASGLGYFPFFPGISLYCLGNVVQSYDKNIDRARSSAPVITKAQSSASTGGYYSHDEAVAAAEAAENQRLSNKTASLKSERGLTSFTL